MPISELVVDFTDDPRAFLVAAEPMLAADPVLTTVVSTMASRAVADAEAGRQTPDDRPCWWVTIRTEGSSPEVVGVAMRTAPFAPYPLYVLPMPEAAAVALARALHDRGEDVHAANGALPATQVVMAELARIEGGTAGVHQHTRLFQLEELASPRPAAGRLRAATPVDHDLALSWFNAFNADAAEQAGRSAQEAEQERFATDDISRRIAEGRVWLWEDDHGEVVHLTGHNLPAFGVVRIGPVYTPPSSRGRGYASAAVAEVSRGVLAQGLRVCLFTDQANPTSNKIYEALGYRSVVDMVNMVVTRPAPA